NVQNKILFAHGYGFSYTTLPPSANSWSVNTQWIDQSIGDEQLVATEAISPPGGTVVAGVEDNGTFYVSNPDCYPSVPGPDNTVEQAAAWSLDYSGITPSYIAGVMAWNKQQSGYSTDGGQTWQYFAHTPPFANMMGGSIAVSTAQNTVWVGSNNQNAYYTQDG